MSLPILIIGAGGHGRVLADLTSSLGRQVLGFLDRNGQLHGKEMDGITVLGGDERLADYPTTAVSLINGIGSTATTSLRRDVYIRLRGLGYQFEPFCHPGAIVGRSVRFESGVQVMAGSIVQNGARIGENATLNTGVIVEHDCVVGAHSHLASGAVICGDVHIGESCHLGVGAVVVQGLAVGDGAMVAAGAVVVKDVPPGTRVAGVPARRMGQT